MTGTNALVRALGYKLKLALEKKKEFSLKKAKGCITLSTAGSRGSNEMTYVIRSPPPLPYILVLPPLGFILKHVLSR